MVAWLTLGVVLAAGVGVGSSLLARRSRTRARFLSLAWLTASAASLLLGAPGMAAAVDTALGITDAAMLLRHGLGIAALYGIVQMFAIWRYGSDGARPVARRTGTLVAASLAVVTILFFAATHPAGDWPVPLWRGAASAGYFLVLAAIVVWLIVPIAWRSLLYLGWAGARRRALRLPTVHHRAGLVGFLIGCAAAAGLAVVAGFAAILGTPVASTGNESILAGASAAGFALGMIGPHSIGLAMEVKRRCRHASLYHDMEPLHRALLDRYPEQAKRTAAYGTAGWITAWLSSGRCLNERSLEILGALMQLRKNMDRLAADTGAAVAERNGLPDAEVGVIAHATEIVDALAATSPDGRTGDSTVPMVQEREAEWLARVSAAFAYSPLVRTALEELSARRSRSASPAAG